MSLNFRRKISILQILQENLLARKGKPLFLLQKTFLNISCAKPPALCSSRKCWNFRWERNLWPPLIVLIIFVTVCIAVHNFTTFPHNASWCMIQWITGTFKLRCFNWPKNPFFESCHFPIIAFAPSVTIAEHFQKSISNFWRVWLTASKISILVVVLCNGTKSKSFSICEKSFCTIRAKILNWLDYRCSHRDIMRKKSKMLIKILIFFLKKKQCHRFLTLQFCHLMEC